MTIQKLFSLFVLVLATVSVTVGCGSNSNPMGPGPVITPTPSTPMTATIKVDTDGVLCSGKNFLSPSGSTYSIAVNQNVCLHLVAENPPVGCPVTGKLDSSPTNGMLNGGQDSVESGEVLATKSETDVIQTGFGLYRGHGAPGTYTVTGTVTCDGKTATTTITIVDK